MSQSTKIKVIIFMITFVLICATGTYFSIKYVNDKKDISNSNNIVQETLPIDKYNSDLPDNSYFGITLGDKYVKNNIELKEISYTDYVKVEYYQISGLKDKQIEEKINKEIKNAIEQKVQESKKNKNKYDINTSIHANYSNVISMCIYDNGDNIYLNYDLTTGNKLEIKDLFINNCDDVVIKKIKQQAMRNWVEKQYYETGNYNEQTDTYTYDLSGMEQYLLDIVNEYTQNSENIKFSFTQDSISVYLNDTYIWINMEEIYEYISIFKKYVTQDSIFENGNMEEENYCLMNRSNINGSLYFGQYNDNLFLNVIFYAYNDSIIKDNYINYIKNKVDLLKENSNEQPDIAKYLCFNMDIYQVGKYQEKYMGLSRVIWREYEYTMPKQEYVTSFKKEMLRLNMLDSYLPIVKEYNKENVSCNIIDKNMYVYINKKYGEIIELSLKDVFIEEYDYTKVIKEKLKNSINEKLNNEYIANEAKEKHGQDIFEKMFVDLEKIDKVDFTFELAGISFKYEIEYNSLTSDTIPYIYISNVLDMKKMK